MSDLITQLVTDHGLAAVLGVISIVIQLRIAAKLFDALSDQNRATARLLERNGLDTDPPPSEPTRRRGGRLLPRAPTPLPFYPSRAEAAPEPVDPEQTDRQRRRR